MAEVSREMLEKAGRSIDEVKLFIPHQANQRITDAVADKLGVDSSIVYSNISQHGNTSSASIPIALDECIQTGKIVEGDLVLMAAFGGGVTWGGTLVQF
jgi:3-oxoacyl-[acyl-carrier-protein] synthase-3